jgi:glycerophosphoryl diester phosphodiesterase
VRRRGPLVAAALAALAAAPAARASDPVVQAHRGGTYVHGVPRFPEETLATYRHAARVEHAVLELDVKLTRDRVPVVVHDDSPDRTTTCRGARPIAAYTLARLQGRCRLDVLGSPGSGRRTRPIPHPAQRIPTLAAVLALAKRTHSRVNLEIKNIPTDRDFDPTPAYADRVIAVIRASRLPRDQLIVQSFWSPNLDRVEQKLPGVETSYLTLDANEASGPALAATHGYAWVSPEFPVSGAYVTRAHDAGLRVVAYTPGSASTSSSRTIRPWPIGRCGASGSPRPRSRRRRAGRPAGACAPTARSRSSPTTNRARERRACSPCSSSRRCATWPPTRASAPRSSA